MSFRKPGTPRVFLAVRLALAFLTVIPQRFRDGEVTDADLKASRFAYPVVGAELGLVLAGLSELLRRCGADAGLAAFLLVAAGAVITGGLHLDGLADSCDGLFLWGDPGRRLAVMRDPHVGSYGVAGVVLVLLGKYAALGALAGGRRSLAVAAAFTISRTLILVAAGLAPYPRPDGTGKVLIGATSRRDALGAALLCLLIGQVLFGLAGVTIVLIALPCTVLLTLFAWQRIGGITGDVLGAVVELGELLVLVMIGLLRAL